VQRVCHLGPLIGTGVAQKDTRHGVSEQNSAGLQSHVCRARPINRVRSRCSRRKTSRHPVRRHLNGEFCGQDLRVVAGVYDPLSNVRKFSLAFLRYGAQHVEGADFVDAVAFHDDAFGLTDAVSCR